MSNKHGDKIQGFKAPKNNKNQHKDIRKDNGVPEELIVTPNELDKEVTEIERPKSNFARKLEKEIDKTEVTSISQVKSEMYAYLDLYRKASGPKEVNKAQMTFYGSITRILKLNHDEFRKEWSELLNFIESNGVIDLVSVNYGVNTWNVERPQQLAYSTIGVIAVLTAPKAERFKRLRDADVDQLLRDLKFFGRKAVDNVIQFYDL